MPLNFIGSVYRDIKQGLIDVEEMFTLLDVDADITDRPGAAPLHRRQGRDRVRQCAASTMTPNGRS